MAGLERYGYAQDLDAITPQSLYALWRQMVETARLEVVVLGAPVQPVEQRLRAVLSARRAPAGLNRPHPMPLRPVLACSEPVSAVQGKLCMLFTMDAALPPQELSKMRMAVALLGVTEALTACPTTGKDVLSLTSFSSSASATLEVISLAAWPEKSPVPVA